MPSARVTLRREFTLVVMVAPAIGRPRGPTTWPRSAVQCNVVSLAYCTVSGTSVKIPVEYVTLIVMTAVSGGVCGLVTGSCSAVGSM